MGKEKWSEEEEKGHFEMGASSDTPLQNCTFLSDKHHWNCHSLSVSVIGRAPIESSMKCKFNAAMDGEKIHGQLKCARDIL